MKTYNKDFSLLFVLFTHNNIFCTLTDYSGKTLTWSTAGSIKVRGSKKVTIASINSIVSRLHINNLNKIHIKLKGINRNKGIFMKTLKSLGFHIVSIQDKLNIPYNGCKNLRKRKV